MKRYMLVAEENGDDSTKIQSSNDGFQSTELLGILYWKIHDILKQMSGEFKPDVIKRNVISEDK